ncbi:class I SAM-dependent methyltransferase [Actinomadura rudentiformis]|uniref:Class I SAM-dependent methyltransferase n=1 Tax=Actinomadura rudentiformis TaxID=359158 RepID=A0A6H9YB30_9ACTN|nr:class I SAM-dependent methyltransferase [Actinomadura rudentiformis]
MLSGYDMGVLGVVCRLVWRCPPEVMLAQYERNVGPRHLELGPGTGYFLDNCEQAAGSRISLVDLNPTVLATASRRLARHKPDTHLRNVLEPLNLGDARFDSAGLNLLLHCVPGAISEKAVIFDRVLPYLGEGARVFGSTVLARGVRHTPSSTLAARLLNARNVFHNVDDTAADLEAELGRRFAFHRIAVQGSVALFEARI